MEELDLNENELMKILDKDRLPVHIAIIMDGNGRWARKRNLPRIFGHREGMKSVKRIIQLCVELNIKILSLFAFSTENWLRPKEEVEGLMELLIEFLRAEIDKLHEKKIKIKTMGRLDQLPLNVQEEINQALELTKDNDGLILNVALNYSGRVDIIEAVKKILKLNRKKIEEVRKRLNERIFSKYLYSEDLPDPDLLIRTSGEFRISNFMLWQLAYTEIWITKILWPDFQREDLLKAIIDFQRRERRFGGVLDRCS